MRRFISGFAIVTAVIFFCECFSQENIRHRPWILTAGIGNWQPHSLNDEPRFDTFGAAGATPFISLSLSMAISDLTCLTFTAGYWSLRDIEIEDPVRTIVCHPLSLELKQSFIPDSKLSAYVVYGGALYWGVENVKSPLEHIHDAQSGWGVNLGAGFDFTVTRKIGLGMVFQYRYAQFKKTLGGVDDFSGPCISVLTHFYL